MSNLERNLSIFLQPSVSRSIQIFLWNVKKHDRTQNVNKKKQSFFSQKPHIGQMDNLIKLPQIYVTSYFMIHSIDIRGMLANMMGCNN